MLGFFAEFVSANDVDDAGITGTIADQINTAFSQPNSTRWIAVFLGLFGMAEHRPHAEQGARPRPVALPGGCR